MPIDYIRAADFGKYDLETAVLYMDVYNDYDTTMDFIPQIFSAAGKVAQIVYLPPKAWTEVKIKLKTVTDLNLAMDWSNLTEFRFMMHEHFGHKAANLYLDNIHIEED
jgi:hypothetical protein